MLDNISQSMLASIRALAFELIQKSPDVARLVSIIDEEDGEHCKIQIGILLDNRAKIDFLKAALKRSEIEAEAASPMPH